MMIIIRAINLHGGIEKVDPSVSIPETWADFSNRNIQASQCKFLYMIALGLSALMCLNALICGEIVQAFICCRFPHCSLAINSCWLQLKKIPCNALIPKRSTTTNATAWCNNLLVG